MFAAPHTRVTQPLWPQALQSSCSVQFRTLRVAPHPGDSSRQREAHLRLWLLVGGMVLVKHGRLTSV